MQNGAATLEISVAVPQSVKKSGQEVKKLPYDPGILFIHIYPREMKTCSHKNLYMCVHTGIINNSQKSKQPRVAGWLSH